MKLTLSFSYQAVLLQDQKVKQKFKYLENEKSFRGEKKAFFTVFKGLSVAKSCVRCDSVPLNYVIMSKRMFLFQFKWSLENSKVILISFHDLLQECPCCTFCNHHLQENSILENLSFNQKSVLKNAKHLRRNFWRE